MTKPRLILASSSPRRRELLEEAGYPFDVVVPGEDAERGVCSGSDTAELVAKLAHRKAADVYRQLDLRPTPLPLVIVAADTVAECDGQVLGKPRDENHARAMLEQLSGRRHRVFSGVCVWARNLTATTACQPLVRVAQTELEMDMLPGEALDEYLDGRQWEGKAGGFGYQDRLGWVRVVEGSESNVVGLPLELLAEMLMEVGYSTSS